jgi:hypothetical protein
MSRSAVRVRSSALCFYSFLQGNLGLGVAAGDIPQHYLTGRRILFSRKELDEWLINQ